MIKRTLLRATAVAVTSVGLVAGMTGIAGATAFGGMGSLNTTGPFSSNNVSNTMSSDMRLMNNNRLSLNHNNFQASASGSSNASDNTIGGSAMSGNAGNNRALNANVSVSNSASNAALASSSGMGGAGSGTISLTGPHSDNNVTNTSTTTTTVTNNNEVMVTSNNSQLSSTGDANVSGNTSGGSAVSGSSSNTSTESISVNISN